MSCRTLLDLYTETNHLAIAPLPLRMSLPTHPFPNAIHQHLEEMLPASPTPQTPTLELLPLGYLLDGDIQALDSAAAAHQTGGEPEISMAPYHSVVHNGLQGPETGGFPQIH